MRKRPVINWVETEEKPDEEKLFDYIDDANAMIRCLLEWQWSCLLESAKLKPIDE